MDCSSMQVVTVRSEWQLRKDEEQRRKLLKKKREKVEKTYEREREKVRVWVIMRKQVKKGKRGMTRTIRREENGCREV